MNDDPIYDDTIIVPTDTDVEMLGLNERAEGKWKITEIKTK